MKLFKMLELKFQVSNQLQDINLQNDFLTKTVSELRKRNSKWENKAIKKRQSRPKIFPRSFVLKRLGKK